MAKSVEMSEKAGVRVGWGTDLDRQMAEKFPGLEFTARSEMGLPNITILREATINCAKILGMDDMLGTVKAGKYADLVVIDGKPDEDMNAMKQVPTYVFKEGKRCTI